jgi:uncharacterized membrane protein YesL
LKEWLLLASRAEARVPDTRVPDAPTIGWALRTALIDFYFNSLRLVPANLLWGAGLVLCLWLLLTSPLLAIPALVLLALPTAGIFHIATMIARDQPVALSDAIDAWRLHWKRAFALAALIIPIAAVLLVNTVLGVASLQLVGWGFATLAVWGLVLLASAALAIWPLAMDPLRLQLSLRELLSLAGAVVFASPARYAALVLVVAVLLTISTIAFAALISVSISYVALVMARYVLPTADRLEGRATHIIETATD